MLMTVFVIINTRDLFVSVILMSVYGLLSASFFALMDAVDVALTEAAVGIAISTLLLLSTLSFTGRYEKKPHHKPLVALLVVFLTGALLVYGTLDMPPFGSAETPAHQHVASYYIEESYHEIGVANLVSSVLASYRGFDTLGELLVIFTAGVGVLSLLSTKSNDEESNGQENTLTSPMTKHHILRVVAKMLIPFIMLYALYIQFHSDFGPGGGFQAGAIFSSALILYTLIYGLQATLAITSQAWLSFFAALGVLLFAGTGIVAMLLKHNFLNYNVLATEPIHGQHLGILLVEFGVGLTVTAVLYSLFISFTGYMCNIRKPV